MYNSEIPHRQLTAWLSAAIIPTAIQVTAGTSWLGVFLVSVMSVLCVWLRWHLGAELRGKALVILQWALLTAVLALACQTSVASWPRGGHPAVAVVLLLLALWSAWKGTTASARVGSLLFWMVLIIYLVLISAGLKDVRMDWLIPNNGDVAPFGCVLLLTPAAAAIHLNKKEPFKPRLLLVGVFCTVAALITLGVLSPQVASTKENAFYEMTRSMNLFGQARRFEAVLSAAATTGWFSLFTLYLTLCSHLAEQVKSNWGKWGMVASAVLALAALLCDVHIPGFLLLILATVFWVLLPLLTQGLGPRKKSSKNKKSA